MKIAIGADHRGYELKQAVVSTLNSIDWNDCGTHDQESSDYPVFAKCVCNQILTGKSESGILICGSGIGMSIAANRYRGIFAALCWNEKIAVSAKEDDNANILVLPSNFVNADLAQRIIKAWISANFKGGRYQARLDMVD